MRIVLVSYQYWPPDFGGELLASIERLQALGQRGHFITVLTSGHVDYASQEFQGKNFEILRSPVIGVSRAQRLLRRFYYIIWACWQLIFLRFDVLHLGTLPGIGRLSSAMVAWLFAWLARGQRARVIEVHSLADSEQDSVNMTGSVGLAWRIHFSAVDQLVAVSPALHEGLRDICPQKACYIPYGVQDEIFIPLESNRRKETRSLLGLREDDVVFAFLGSVGRRKGFDLLAQAFSILAKDHPRWYLWIFGPYTPQESRNINVAEVTDVAQLLVPLKERVKYFGRMDDRSELALQLALADIFVFPSRKEGMGIAPNEAMAVGLPVIVARIPGVTDLVNLDQETGLFIPVDDVFSLLQAMKGLGEQPALRLRMGAAARYRIISAFGWQKYVEKWEKLYLNGETKGE